MENNPAAFREKMATRSFPPKAKTDCLELGLQNRMCRNQDFHFRLESELVVDKKIRLESELFQPLFYR